ncbi:Protein glutamine dumper 3 [Apostasia shenzhenica]|uniref:Protein glutamine dumper 3 n=1 Tax=Apostasia shenzhenica TaxID=1088818 RepID=A0A2I0BCD3_9ASPA|nr:Protein glutamine dumper 3 [Apostasia shenzhenica]
MRQAATFAGELSPAPETAAKLGIEDHPEWRSPVPYLFGGMAAMLGLIAAALLILAFSYWKISGFLEVGEENGSAGSGGENGKIGEAGGTPPAAVYEERIVVIMPGDEKPKFLATPMYCRASSFREKKSSASEITGGRGDGVLAGTRLGDLE